MGPKNGVRKPVQKSVMLASVLYLQEMAASSDSERRHSSLLRVQAAFQMNYQTFSRSNASADAMVRCGRSQAVSFWSQAPHSGISCHQVTCKTSKKRARLGKASGQRAFVMISNAAVRSMCVASSGDLSQRDRFLCQFLPPFWSHLK